MEEKKENCRSWLIAIATCVVNCILMCPYKLSGLLFVALLEQFNTSREKASMPVFMSFLMVGLIGPLSGWIGHKFGEETTCVIGTFVASIGFGMTYFAKDITYAIISLGLVYGFGMALGITLLPNILKKHFNKNFNTASGISLAGPCLGALIFPPIAVWMMKTYGVSGTFLLIGGLALHGVPISMLLKAATPNRMDPSQRLKKVNTTEEFLLRTNIKKENKIENQKPSNGFTMLETTYNKIDIKNQDLNFKLLDVNETKFKEICKPKILTPHRELSISKDNSNHCSNRSTYDLYSNLLKDVSFLIYMTTVCLNIYIVVIVWTTIIDYSRDKRIDRKYEVYLLMFPSLTDLFGRLALVWLIDNKHMSSTMFAIILNLTLALSTGMMIFSTSILLYMSGALIFGMGSGALITAFPGQVFEHMERDFYIPAMSSRMLLYVPLSFTASPLIEYFRTQLLSYDGLFYLVIAICLLNCFLTPLIGRFSKVKKKKFEYLQETEKTLSSDQTV